MLGGLPVKDAQQDDGCDPGIALVVVDDSEAEERDDKGDDDDNYDPDNEGETSPRDRAQQLASHDARNRRVANIDDDVEDTAQLGSPDS